MLYTTRNKELENWLITETSFKAENQGKCEAIFGQGNGYLGMRHATEETYFGTRRNLFVAGTFNKFDEHEVTELPNAADVAALDILIDGERFTLDRGSYREYSRSLNLKTGESNRSFIWTSPTGKEFSFTFTRFVSRDNRHLIASTFKIVALTHPANIEVKSGINAQLTNTGSQHFHEGEKRIYNKKVLQLVSKTTQSKIDFVFTTTHDITVADKEVEINQMLIERRAISVVYREALEVGQTMKGVKKTLVYTTRDNDIDSSFDVKQLQAFSREACIALEQVSYAQLLEQSIAQWKTFWDEHDIIISSKRAYDQLAIRFAQYHLSVMTPAHDNRMGIAAKGLSGEGYKGHSFWDTEIFMFPYWMYTQPEVARNLLEYRYNTIEGAYKKAKENGYEGAMYPWESAWADDGEVTPLWGAVDIVTGESTKIWSGLIEIHITADIIVALWQYYTATNDVTFMEQYGYEMIYQTALFWSTRFEWKEERQRYEITNVIGSDEYKEHVDNNALTNYMAHHNMKITLACHEMLQAQNPERLAELETKFGASKIVEKIKEMLSLIYLPQPREGDQIIPQDDTYLTLKDIDISPYKNHENVGTMFHDYNLKQVGQMQVSKQADVVMLLYLLEDLFDKETKWKNFEYYEARTLHDSSLSLSTHSILGNDLGRTDLAYKLFCKATEIDLGPNMKTSDDGIHAAAMGGIWQCCVNGFGGIRIVGDTLRIMPKLPENWDELIYRIYWKQQPLTIRVTQTTVEITHNGDTDIEILGPKGKATLTAKKVTTIEL